MYCFNNNNVEPFDHDVYLTKQPNKMTQMEYTKNVAPQSIISHTLFWLWFFPIGDGKDGGDESLSPFVLSSHLKLKEMEKTDDIGTCSLAKIIHTSFEVINSI